jgi:hypothetical protein
VNPMKLHSSSKHKVQTSAATLMAISVYRHQHPLSTKTENEVNNLNTLSNLAEF